MWLSLLLFVRCSQLLSPMHDWPIHQFDVKNVFFHGTLGETVYCVQPTGFVDSSRSDFVCRLNKSLYGLKQTPLPGTVASPLISSPWVL